MLPAQRNKVDISVRPYHSRCGCRISGLSVHEAEILSQKLTEEEQKLFRLYGKLPNHKNVITKMQKVRS
jgi:hypothetical protein